MSETSHGARRNRVLALLGVAGLAIGTVVTSTPAIAAPATPTATYIVQLADLPAASYTGGITGYERTKPQPGQKIDGDSAAVNKYEGYLAGRHKAALDSVPGAHKVYDYTLTFNGFAAELTTLQANTLSRNPGVLSVTKNEMRTLDTTNTPEFLGLSKEGGLWSRLGGTGARGAGDGVVVGVLDSGLWPESKSFAPLQNPRRIRDWRGTCVTGEGWTASTCNNKIIGARFYNRGLDGDDPGDDGNAEVKALFPYEYVSARDADGHGSHTSSTAAGNFGVDAIVEGASLGMASGMAPNARVAMYKVCWGRGGDGGCATVDSMKAIEDATADGVDVLNFSISGSRTSMTDPVEQQMMFAADAGVFVSMSAGNDGPGASTVAHNTPWATTVAASTHDRVFNASVTLGNGQTVNGTGLGAAVPSAPIVLSTAVGKAGADATEVRLCFIGALDPAKAAGKIVVCDRGANARTDKSAEVKAAGGVGMVLANTSPNSLNADLHSVPTVHVDHVNGATIKAYMSGTASPTAALVQGVQQGGAKAPFVTSFSSRGPSLASGDLLKPDILAPGVDVLAAVSPDGHAGRNFDFVSGTSMSSPHVAGLGALLRQLHPNWSPMAIKSALMTTAAQTDNKGEPISNDDGSAGTPFDFGSGFATPNSAADPGLVYDSELRDWVRFMCGADQLAGDSRTCRRFGRIDPSDLNTPNIAIGELADHQTVTRRVTNVTRLPAIYVPTVQVPAGMKVSVSPRFLFVAPGRSVSYRVTVSRDGAAFNEWQFGSLTWTDGRHKVRSQIVVRPVALDAQQEVAGSGTSGSTTLNSRTGYSGTLTASVAGLVPGARDTTTLANPTGSGFDQNNPTASDHTMKATITVPEGTELARFRTYNADYPVGTDLDMFVYEAGTTNQVGLSAGGTSEETVSLPKLPAGDYDVYVDLFGLSPGAASVDATLFSWSVGTQSAGNVTVSPASQTATLAGSTKVTVSWTGLTAGERYLGQVQYGDGTSTVATTVFGVTS